MTAFFTAAQERCSHTVFAYARIVSHQAHYCLRFLEADGMPLSRIPYGYRIGFAHSVSPFALARCLRIYSR
jgi:hypothetical protein